MIENTMEIFGLVMFVMSLASLLKYIILTIKYPKALKTFSVSVITFFIFAAVFCIVESILFFKVRYKSKIDGQAILYIIMSVIYLWNVIVLYYISSYRLQLEDEYMIYFDIFGRKKRYCYKDITKFEEDPISGYYKIYFDKKKIEVPYFIEDQQKVLEFIKDYK